MVKPPLRTKSIGFKVSEEEYAQLETAAQAEGRTLGEWCREVILRGGSARDAERHDAALAEIVGVRRVAQAFDFFCMTNIVGAPSFRAFCGRVGGSPTVAMGLSRASRSRNEFAPTALGAKLRRRPAKQLGRARQGPLRNSRSGNDGGISSIPAAKRRHVKARHGSAGRPGVEQTESASADGTKFRNSLVFRKRWPCTLLQPMSISLHPPLQFGD
jgi:hypothetical protein